MPEGTIGWIGLGHLGGRMAQRLAGAGHDLVVFDADRAAVEAAPGRAADSPADVARRATLVFTCLPTEEALREAVLGEDGVAAAAGDGHGLVDCSTVAPATAREIGDAVRARGGLALDASVSGSTIPAEKGELVMLVGGDRELFDRCEGLFEAFAKASWYMGESGHGAATKLVVNTILGTVMQGIAEAIALGVRSGLDRDHLLELLESLDVVPVAHKPKMANVRDDDYPVAFALRLMHKDFGLAARLADERGAVMPMTAVAAQMNAAEQAKGEEEDFSAVVRLMLELSGAAHPAASGRAGSGA
jgi:3-hydroxyisobutyrate dehydrogenase